MNSMNIWYKLNTSKKYFYVFENAIYIQIIPLFPNYSDREYQKFKYFTLANFMATYFAIVMQKQKYNNIPIKIEI